jgi:hypothetical protein
MKCSLANLFKKFPAANLLKSIILASFKISKIQGVTLSECTTKLRRMVSCLRVRTPHSRARWRDRLVLLSNPWMRGKCTCQPRHTPASTWGCLTHMRRMTDQERGWAAKTLGWQDIN